MQLPSNWGEVPPAGTQRPRPPEGEYVFVITGAEETTSNNNNEMIVLRLDICEGMFSGYFENLSQDIGKDLRPIVRQVTEGLSLSFFKGLITSIERSNPGYEFTGNVQSLIGLKVAGILFEEKYEDKNGKEKSSLKIDRFFSVKKESDPKKKQKNEEMYDDDLPF